MPGEAEPRAFDGNALHDEKRLQVHDRQRRLRVAVVLDDEVAAIGRLDHREGQITDGKMLSRRRDPPAIRQERVALLPARTGAVAGIGGENRGGRDRQNGEDCETAQPSEHRTSRGLRRS
jgi:hypothetical protein